MDSDLRARADADSNRLDYVPRVSDEPERLRLAKIAHLDSLLANIDRDWQRIPKIWWLAIFALPIAVFRGLGWAIVEIACVASLVAVVMYILGVRREEYKREKRDIERDITVLKRGRGETRDDSE